MELCGEAGIHYSGPGLPQAKGNSVLGSLLGFTTGSQEAKPEAASGGTNGVFPGFKEPYLLVLGSSDMSSCSLSCTYYMMTLWGC